MELTLRKINMREIVKKYLQTRNPQLLKKMRSEEIRFVNRPENQPKPEPKKDDSKNKKNIADPSE